MIHDLLVALRRSLYRARSQPAATLIVVLTLAVALGAVTALFDLVNLIQWQPIPGARAQRLVRVYTAHPQPFIGPYGYQPQVDYEHYRDGASALTAVVAERLEFLPGRLPDGSERTVQVYFVPGNYFETLGVLAASGRLLEPSDDRAEPLAVVSHGFWKRALGGGEFNPGAQSLVVADVDVPIVGVVAENFTSMAGDQVEVWMALHHGDTMVPGFSEGNRRSTGILALLEDAASIGQAQAELQIIANELDRTHPLTDVPREVTVIPAGITHPVDQRNFRPILRMLFLGAGLLLLLAASNVATVQLARALRLRPEFAVQRAMGAKPLQLLRQQALDAVVLVIGAALLALPIAIAARRLFALWDLEAFAEHLRIDLRVVLAMLVAATLVTLLVSVGPMLLALRTAPAQTLRSGGRETGRQRTFDLLTGLQVALSTILLLLTGVVFLDLQTLSKADLGFDSTGLIHVQIDGGVLGLDGEQTLELTRRIERELPNHPEVDQVGRSLFVPPIFLDVGRQYRLPGEDEARQARLNFAVESYFETLGLRRLEGPGFTPPELQSDPPRKEVVINELLARQLWPERSPIGRSLEIIGQSRDDEDLHEIVGVVETIAQKDLKSGGEPILYFDLDQRPRTNSGLAIRLRPSPIPDEERIATVRRVLGELQPGLDKVRMRTPGQVRHEALVVERLRSQTIGLLGLIGLTLTAIGIWGVLHLQVARRRREWALRSAIGASPTDVTFHALRQAFVLLLLGAAAGLLAAIWVLRMARAEFGELESPLWLWAAAAATVGLCGIAAAFSPARRASRVAPAEALRE